MKILGILMLRDMDSLLKDVVSAILKECFKSVNTAPEHSHW